MKHSCNGNILLLTLLLMTLATAMVGVIVSETGTVARNTDRSRDYLTAQAAAEGAVDYAYAVWLKRTNNAHNLLKGQSVLPGPSFSGTNAPPGSGGFVYTPDGAPTITPLDKYGVPITTSTTPDPVIGKVPGYAGWWGITYTYAATAKVMAVGETDPTRAAGVRRLFLYSEVPLFQTMFFFQDDLEIYNPAPIVLSGLIHTNSNLYLSVTTSSDLEVNGNASYGGTYSTKEPPGVVGSNYDYGNLQPPTWNNGGETAQLHEVTQLQPLGASMQADFPPPYGTNTDPKAKTDPNLQNGYHELIEPPGNASTDPPELAQRRLYNKAGLIIKVSGTNKTYPPAPASLVSTKTGSALTSYLTATYGVTLTAQNGAVLPDPSTTAGAEAYIKAYNAITKSLTKQNANDASGVFYDARVGTNINVVNLDLSVLSTNHGALIDNKNAGYLGPGFNGVLYIYDATVSANANAIRLRNGEILPSDPDNFNPTQGLTVASLNPIYIEGDYNTGLNAPSSGSNPTSSSVPTGKDASGAAYSRLPAAVIGDAIMLLSNNWSDLNSTKPLSSRTASNTTYNTSLLGGYMPTANGKFSGGAVNYPRFLEGWSGKYCTYWGSMVELFPSKTMTQPWAIPGTYYTAPDRFYNFDTNYSHTAPPGTVAAVVLSRGPWSKY